MSIEVMQWCARKPTNIRTIWFPLCVGVDVGESYLFNQEGAISAIIIFISWEESTTYIQLGCTVDTIHKDVAKTICLPEHNLSGSPNQLQPKTAPKLIDVATKVPLLLLRVIRALPKKEI